MQISHSYCVALQIFFMLQFYDCEHQRIFVYGFTFIYIDLVVYLRVKYARLKCRALSQGRLIVAVSTAHLRVELHAKVERRYTYQDTLWLNACGAKSLIIVRMTGDTKRIITRKDLNPTVSVSMLKSILKLYRVLKYLFLMLDCNSLQHVRNTMDLEVYHVNAVTKEITREGFSV